MPDLSLPERLDLVRERIERACARAHRDPATVHLLAVTKIFGPEVIREAWSAGLREFGENYVQEMERKQSAVADLDGARFHLIGHLQSNKTKKAAQMFSAIDSVDSVKLATRLDAEAIPLDVMIEVKVSDEESKTGAQADALAEIVAAIRMSKHLTLKGLMTVPPWSEDAELSRPYFARLRELAAMHNIPELSMGMSNDMEVAIEEGATWVRVGTALFGSRKPLLEQTRKKALTLGYHAPPSGARTGVADYAETLRDALNQSAPAGVTIQPNADQADIHLYHLGNNRLHADIYSRAIKTPGIVVIHDAVLHHFLLGQLSPEQYMEEFVYNYGEWSRHVGEDLWRERAACAVDPRFFRYSLLRRAVENQLAVIVHNPGAAEIAREHGARNVRIIPHFFERRDIPDAAATERFRQSLRIEPAVTLFGIFGYLRESKRILPCINAFRRLNAVRPNTALLIAGEVVSGDLKRLLASEAPHTKIHRIGHLPDAYFRIAAAAVDCCLNLRYPAAGETSGIAIRLMGIGKPVIVTEGPETSDIPPTAALRVPAGPEEAETLFNQMALISGFPAVAKRIGAEAVSHIQENHSLKSVANQYWQVLDSIANPPAELT